MLVGGAAVIGWSRAAVAEEEEEEEEEVEMADGVGRIDGTEITNKVYMEFKISG